MQLNNPAALAFLLFLPLLFEPRFLVAALKATLRRFGQSRSTQDLGPSSSALRFSSRIPLNELPRSWTARFAGPFLNTLSTLAYICLVIALARPQTVRSVVESEEHARDIIFALDLSGSMEAVDFFIDGERVTRLTALKQVVSNFIDRRSGDRIGLVVFGKHAFTQCPLTTDHQAVKEFVEQLAVGMAGQATAVGDALAVALKRVRDIPAATKVIVIVTDGASNAGSFSPEEAAKLAAELGVKIHAIGIGGDAPAPFWQQNFFGGKQLVQHHMEYDEETLKNIAKTTGGQFFNAKDTAQLEDILQAVNTLEERTAKTSNVQEFDERFVPFAAVGLLLFIVGEALGATLFLRIP